MKKSVNKKYALFTLVFCGFVSLLGVISLFFTNELSAFGRLSDNEITLYAFLVFALSILAFSPPSISLIGFYFMVQLAINELLIIYLDY